MDNRRNETCGCGGPGIPVGENKPLYELKLLVAALERQEAERKAKEQILVLEAASRWALGEEPEKKAG